MPQNLLELVEQHNTILQDIFDKHALVHKCTITIHPQAPWYNEKQLKRKLEKSWQRTKLEVGNQNHLDQCAKVNTMLLKSKRDYYNTRIANMAGNQRALFRETAKLLNHNILQKLPSHSSLDDLVNRFTDIFEDTSSYSYSYFYSYSY